MSNSEDCIISQFASKREMALTIFPAARQRFIVFLFSISMLLVMTSCSGKKSDQVNELVRQNDSLKTCLQSAEVEIRELKSHAGPKESNSILSNGLRSTKLSKAQINLASDLCNHPELLPQEKRCEAGGQFIFWKDGIYKISDCWIMAYFEDGLCGGHMLLEYKIADNNAIIWKPLAFKMM